MSTEEKVSLQTPTKALSVSDEVSKGIFDGEISMLLYPGVVEKAADEPFFLMNEQEQLVGYVRVDSPVTITEELYVETVEKHGRNDEFGPDVAVSYTITEVGELEEPIQGKSDEDSFITEIEIVKKEDFVETEVIKFVEERVVAVAVLVPNVPDLQGHIYDGPSVRAAAYYWLANYRKDSEHGLDVMHDMVVVPDGIQPVQSFVLDQETTYNVDIPALDDEHPMQDVDQVTYPEDTWIMWIRYVDDELWNGVKDGTYKSVSIKGPVLARDIEES